MIRFDYLIDERSSFEGLFVFLAYGNISLERVEARFLMSPRLFGMTCFWFRRNRFVARRLVGWSRKMKEMISSEDT